jgi:hypothetical protein
MNLNKRQVKWALLGLFVMLVVAMAVAKPIPRPKARAQRIQAVNCLSGLTVSMPLTNAPAPASSKQ